MSRTVKLENKDSVFLIMSPDEHTALHFFLLELNKMSPVEARASLAKINVSLASNEVENLMGLDTSVQKSRH